MRPDTIHTEQGRQATADGLDLQWRSWQGPEGGPSSGSVLLFAHGLCEHSGRYEETGRHFAALGYPAYAFDFRGHGGSPGRRVHVRRFGEFLLDLEAVIALVRSRHPDRPLVLLGHSHGGLVALLEVLRRGQVADALALTSPLLGFHPASRLPAPAALALAALSRLAPGLRLPLGIDPRGVSRDPEVVEKYARDPLVSRKASARWFTEAVGAMAEVQARASELAVPTLLMVAGEDRLVDTEASLRFGRNAPPEMLEAVRWDGLYHELLNEPERLKIRARLLEWLRGGRVKKH
jgi:alpha-beta hydrolase superfamily lysophospholipase